jgi:hypothetical protein
MRFGTRFHLIHLLQRADIALTAMVEASIGTTNALNTKVAAPISTEDLGATMKLTPTMTDALHGLREARAVTVMINRK